MSYSPFFSSLLHWTARGMEATGTLIIALGALAATANFLRLAFRAVGAREAYQEYRVNLGRAILLGLEFLVAADIVGTVAIEPTFQNLGVLALIVLVRTGLSFALEVEVNGHWPWQTSQLTLSSSRTEEAS
ncbi:MAG: DUF1622 domain-containing protein [Candidatus Palauibacterales bacterium]|nr:DUF1622 domain-containing protein [Candidatus Palauibacterales bacterium]MDP2582774.1 DUF1622 domain-containing protein [Candidatus Palauibacterales bacterium]